MKFVQSISKQEARSLKGVLFDLDDTFLDHTSLSKEAYSSLFRLRESGLSVIALTGRPASWAELIVRMWPVDGAIAENGSLGYVLTNRVPVLMDSVSQEERGLRRARLDELVREVVRAVPELAPANDVHGRISDFTFDIGETRHVEEGPISRAIELAHRRGARTTRSSVHLHLTFDRMDKGSGAVRFLTQLGFDATLACRNFAFVGDSQNDAPAFAAFSTTVGVANLKGDFSLPPRYLTSLPKSAGFCQLVDHLYQQRLL